MERGLNLRIIDRSRYNYLLKFFYYFDATTHYLIVFQDVEKHPASIYIAPVSRKVKCQSLICTSSSWVKTMSNIGPVWEVEMAIAIVPQPCRTDAMQVLNHIYNTLTEGYIHSIGNVRVFCIIYRHTNVIPPAPSSVLAFTDHHR